MQKITLIIVLLILFSGCSVIKTGREEKQKASKVPGSERLIEFIREQNITEESFIIQRANIEIAGNEVNNKMIASVKFSKAEEFLISVRGKTGIEAARIFISPDTILINDRINRQQLIASPDYLKSKYGLSQEILPLLFGDFIDSRQTNKNLDECIDGMLYIDSFVEGIKIRYLIDCKIGKALAAIVESSLNDRGIEFHYKKFFKYNGKWIPGEIEVKNLLKETNIIISLDKITVPWEGIIEFIPGRKYEIIELL